MHTGQNAERSRVRTLAFTQGGAYRNMCVSGQVYISIIIMIIRFIYIVLFNNPKSLYRVQIRYRIQSMSYMF